MGGHVVSMPLVHETPVRTGTCAIPTDRKLRLRQSRSSTSAAAAKADPVEFRLRLLNAGKIDDSGFKRARSIACVKAAAEAYGWDPRPSPNHEGTKNKRWQHSHRAWHRLSYRNQTVVAQVVEVEVNRQTGRVWAKRMVCAHDCGLVINPEALRRTVECGMLHSLSRALHEEVQFDTEKTTGVDWISHLRSGMRTPRRGLMW